MNLGAVSRRLKPTHAPRARRQLPLIGLWVVWVAAVLPAYYTQLWRLLAAGPAAWVGFSRQAASTVVPLALAGIGLSVVWTSGAALHRNRRSRFAGVIALSIVGLAGLLVGRLGITATAAAQLGLPAFWEAAARAMRGIAGCAALLLAAQVVGAGVLHVLRWQAGHWSERGLYRTVTGLGTLSYSFFVLAGLGRYNPMSIRAAVGFLVLLGTVGMLRQRRLSGRVETAPAQPEAEGHAPTREERLWKALTVLALLVAFIGALAPEREYDAVWYHLGFPRLWLERGHLVDLPAEYVSLYPMTWELLYGAGLALGGPVAAKLLHFACLPLIAVLVHRLTCRFAPRASPWLAVVAFVTIPTVLWEATTAYVDLAVTLEIGLMVYALLQYAEHRQWPWLALGAISLGLGLATKHLAFIALALGVVGLTAMLWRWHRSARRAIGTAFLFGVLAATVALPWYVRSWQASGNPVFPELYGLFGATPDRWDALSERGVTQFEDHFGRPRTLFNLLTLPWDLTIHAARYGGTLGPLFLLLMPLLILLRRESVAVGWLAAFVVLYGVLWASPLSTFQFRLLLPITPLLAVLAAEAVARLLVRWKRLARGTSRVALTGGLATLLVVNLPPFIPLHETDRVGWDGWLTHVVHRIPFGVVLGHETEERYLRRAIPSYMAWQYINTHTAPDALILTFSGGDHLYGRRNRLWSDAAIARPATWGAPAGHQEGALRALRTLGVTHVLFDKQQLSDLAPGTLVIAEPVVRAKWYRLEYEDSQFVLYRLRWEQLTSRG